MVDGMPASANAEPQHATGGRDRWWATFFDDLYRRADLDAQGADATQQQVDSVVAELGLDAGARVLDLGCGTGRHAVELACRGMEVTAVDLNADYLERARCRADAAGVEIAYQQADMRELEVVGGGPFDGAISMYTSFGFFHQEQENLDVLRQVGARLSSEGRLYLDLINRDWLLRSFGPSDFVEQGDGITIRDYDDRSQPPVLHEDHFSGATSMLRWTITECSNPPRTAVADYRVYSQHEVARLLDDAGMQAVRWVGGYDGRKFTIFEPRLVAIAGLGGT